MSNFFTKVKSVFSNFSFKVFFKEFYEETIKFPLFLLTHPIKGYDYFKRDKLGKTKVAIFFLVLMIFVQIISYNYNGFLINNNNPKDFNLMKTIAIVVFAVVIGTVGNWSCTALMDGKGKMIEIFRVICYSFFPFIWLSLFATIISNFIVLDEVVFFTFFNSLGVLLLAYMMFFGLIGIHEYGLLKGLFMVLFTVLAIAVILFIMLLFLSLIQQFYSFISSVYEEFRMRFLQ